MDGIPDGSGHRDRTLVLRAIGAAALAAGAAAAVLAPLELYTFRLFSEGGRFHYEGFGFGSFMFGNIACQILGYYAAAVVLIPIGYGHFVLRRWARHATLALLQAWIVVGIPLTVAFLFVLLSSKDLSVVAGVSATILAVAFCFLLPAAGIPFYDSRDVRLTFARGSAEPHRIEGIPVPILALSASLGFLVLVLHGQIFFNGLFPAFGTWLNALQGTVALDFAILGTVVLIAGTLKRRRWAWWAGVAGPGVLASSYVITFLATGWRGILDASAFAPSELRILERVPIRGWHLALLAGIPLTLLLAGMIAAKRCFGRAAQATPRAAAR